MCMMQQIASAPPNGQRGMYAIQRHRWSGSPCDEATGMPPENLEDQDLQETMAELNIQSQPVTPEDEAALAG